MNLSPSRVLLALSMAAYTYCSWDHILPSKKPDAEPSKPIALTAAMVNHIETLSIGRDVFESTQIDRGVGDALPGDDAGDPGTASASATGGASDSTMGSAAAGQPSSSLFSLQGVFMTPEGHAALINGTPVTEGEVVTIGAGGPKILATKIGEDYAIIEYRGRTQMLKLSDPPIAGASAASSNASSSSNSGSSNPANNPPPPGTSRNGYSDPYAGHRTGHHQ